MTMNNKDKKIKWTRAEIKEHIKKIEKIVEQNKRENKHQHFMSMTAEEIEEKFKRVNSPMIISEGWSNAVPGGVVSYDLGVYNPDPTQAIQLYAHVWVGSGNIDRVTGTFLGNVDTRFPRLTQPSFPGLTLASSAGGVLNFELKTPASIEKTNYLGNGCLMRFTPWNDIGTYLDRCVFVFQVT